MHSQAAVLYREDRPSFATSSAGAECFLSLPLFLPVINSSSVSLNLVGAVALNISQYNVTVDFSFFFEQSVGTQLVIDFQLWFDDGPAPIDNLDQEKLLLLSGRKRNGRIYHVFGTQESQNTLNAYFQVRFGDCDELKRKLSICDDKHCHNHGRSGLVVLAMSVVTIMSKVVVWPHRYCSIEPE